ncbi:MAG: SGNH/GDSL hydrolase family protein [Alteraurantiacibacter sp.]
MRPFVALAALTLAGCATLPAASPALLATDAALPAGSHYVALGSSNAAGANIPPLATGRPTRCGASQVSYARLLASRLNLDLTDATCGGATTVQLLAPWNELPAQIDAVTPATRLVTISVGGNDLNYMGAVFAGSCRAGVTDPRRAAGEACPTVPEPGAADYARVEDRLAAVVEQVHARAPAARVVLVQYLTLVGEAPCAAAPLPEADAALVRRLAANLATATARAAQRSGAEVLQSDVASQDHTACSAQPWTRGLVTGYSGAEGAPWHPTAAGHAAIADMLERLLAG